MRRPPRLARAMLARLLPVRVRDAVLEDLDTRYAEHGHSRRWYLAQALAAVRPALGYRTESSRQAREAIPRKKNHPMESFLQDLKYGLRSVRRSPGFAAVVVLTLGVGIGVNTAIFSIVNGVLLRPLPYDNADRLVMVGNLEKSGELTYKMQAPDAVDLVAETDAVEAVAIFTETVVGPMNDIDSPLHVKQARVSHNLFDVLGVTPHIGRTFIPEDDTPLPRDDEGNVLPDPPPYASVISYGLWQRAYGGDPGVLGQSFRLWGRSHVVVGVLPEDFRLLTPAAANIGTDIDVFNAQRMDYPSFQREAGADFWRGIGLLAEGTTLNEAQAEATALSARLRQRDAYSDETQVQLQLESLQAGVAAPVRGTLVVFMGAVVFVLLIACANVANLLLVRGSGRGNEIAVRAAMGAGRFRIVRQLLTEAAVLALAGGGLGVALASGAVALIRGLNPGNLPRAADIGIDAQVLWFTVAVGLMATLASALLPALNASHPARSRTLGQRDASGPAKRSQRVLVVAEVALSMVLLVGAGLMILTFTELQTMSLGFEHDQVITVTATQGAVPRTIESSLDLERELIANVTALPGVEAAGTIFPVPMNGVYDRSAEFVHTGSEEDELAWNRAYFRTVTPSYFDTVGLDIRGGRGISRIDADIDVKNVVIDERLAAQYFRDRNPIGERITVRGMRGTVDPYVVVGVVEYSPQWDHRGEQPTMYFHRVQYMSAEISVVARIAGDPAMAGPLVRDTIKATAPEMPADLVPLSWFVDEALSPTRFVLVLMSAFSGMALLLASIGLYAVLAYTVRQQTREIGIRMALGAEDTNLVRSVVGQGTALAAIGAALGLGAWMLVGRLLESQLYGVSTLNPLALAGTATVLIAVAALASYVPARRAARIDPAVALRAER